MESGAYIKNLRISPKKLRFMLAEIKKLSPVEAMDKLNYMSNHPAKIFFNSIKSAVTNAKNVLKVDEKTLKFKYLTVEEGRRLKRFRAGGRGTAKPILKRFAHIKIVLMADEPVIEKKEEKVKSLPLSKESSKVKSQISKPKLKAKKSK